MDLHLEDYEHPVDWHLFTRWLAYLTVVAAVPLAMLVGMLLIQAGAR